MGPDVAADFDLFIIGGGINGCGIARDAAGRGYSVMLAEMGDLAGGTSSGSTKLIHGGLRYLEYYEFRLVREALGEREVLWANAPHIIWPMRFILPLHKGMRPAWLIRLGLFIYDHLGGRRKIPPTTKLDLETGSAGAVLKPFLRKAFEYSDCWVNDARLVVLSAMDAAQKGAEIHPRTKCISAIRKGDIWQITTRDINSGVETRQSASMLINAAGPWVDQVLSMSMGSKAGGNIRLVQGSHIVVPRIFEHDKSYFFQNDDGRICFAIPYEQDFTLIGTTDNDYDGDPSDVAISAAEISYLCRAVSEYFKKPVVETDVIWSYSAVRPLYDDGASAAREATREYVLTMENASGQAPLLNVFGGKITTYRRLAEAALERVEGNLGRRGEKWTKDAALPGGDFPIDGFDELQAAFAEQYPFLDAQTTYRLVRSYGTRVWSLFGGAESAEDLGWDFGHGLSARELEYLMDNEWATTAEDVLWRRSKLGLRLSQSEALAVSQWMERRAQDKAG